MKDLTTGNIYKTFMIFAIPLVLSGLLSQCYNLIDTVIAGKFLGDAGLAAIGSTSPFISFSSAFFWGYASGASIYVASLFGARKYRDIKNAVYHNLITVTLASLLFGILAVICSDGILRFLQVDPLIYHDAKLYFNLYIIGFFFMLLSNNFLQLLNAFGISSFPFYMSIISAVLNVAGNIITITILHWGVAGVAFSTLFSALVVDICYLYKLRMCFKEMGVLHEKVHFDFDLVRKITVFSFPSSMQQFIMYVAGLAISPLVNGIGSHATAAYTVVQQIYSFIANLYQNSSKTLGNYTAQCVGAGKLTKLNKGVRTGFMQGVFFVAAPILLCTLLPEQVCSLFFPDNYKGEGLHYAILFARFYLPFILFNVINNLFHSFYRGTASMKLLVSLTATGAVARIVCSIIFVHFFGMQGVYIGWVLSWIAESVLALWTYFSGAWKKDLPKYEVSL